MWNTPDRRWEKPLDDLMAMNGLGGLDSGGQPEVSCHISFNVHIIVKSHPWNKLFVKERKEKIGRETKMSHDVWRVLYFAQSYVSPKIFQRLE